MFLGKSLKWNLNFQNWSKSLCLDVFQPTKRLTNKSTAQGKPAFVKENEKKKERKRKKKSKSVKSLRYMNEFFFPTNDFSLLESCHRYINATYQPSNCCKIEAAIQGCSIKKVFLKILQKNPVPVFFNKVEA